MSVRHPALRSGAALLAGLLVAATISGGVAGASRTSGPAARPAQVATTAPSANKKTFKPLPHRTAGTRKSVNVKRLAAKKPTVRPTRELPRLSGPTGSTGSKPPKAGVLAVPPAPSPATTNSDGPAAQTPGFAGLSDQAALLEPPDPWVAVGPEHIVQAVNLSLRITDRQGTLAVPDVTLADFFGLPTDPVSFNTDPHVIYDSLHGRWFMTEASWDCDTSFGNTYGTGYIDFAVSRTSDPTGTWDQGFIYWSDQFPDFPAPGTSTDKVAIANNLYDMTQNETSPGDGGCLDNSTLNTGDVAYMDWADLTNGGGFFVAEAALDEIFDTPPLATFTPRAALQVPATSPSVQQVVGYANGIGSMGVLYFTTIGSVVSDTATIDAVWDLTTDGVVASWLDPPQPIQPGGAIGPDIVDSRPTDALWQNDRLVFVSTYPCGTGPRDCVRVTEVNTAGSSTTLPTRTQDFLVAESGKDIFMGGVGLTGNGTLHVAWTRSSSSDNPSSYTAHQAIGDTDSISAAELLAAGTGPYSGDRWGDYVGVAQDPQVPSQAWDGNQYSGTTEWRTRITALRTTGTTYVPIAAVRVLDTRVGTGLSGPFTANTARSWQVTNGTTIPNGAVAVTGNLTVTGQTASGYVSVTVTPTSSPPSSTINFPKGETRANNVTIPLSSAGKLSAVYKAGAGKKTQLIFDVTGYFLADDTGATFTPLASPVRVLSTVTGVGLPGKFVANTARTLIIGDGGTSGVPTTATAVTGNLTIVTPTKGGYASVTKDPTSTPLTSTINFPAGSVRANGVFAPLDTNHAVSIVYKASAGATVDIILDITGYFEPGTGGLRFVPLTPSRIMDSRSSAVLSGITGAFTSSAPKTLPVEGHWGVPTTAAAVTGNLTVTGQTAGGYVSATPDPTATPATSTLNFPKGDTMANGIVAPLNGSGASSFVYKASSGKTTQLILDLSGYFEP